LLSIISPGCSSLLLSFLLVLRMVVAMINGSIVDFISHTSFHITSHYVVLGIVFIFDFYRQISIDRSVRLHEQGIKSSPKTPVFHPTYPLLLTDMPRTQTSHAKHHDFLMPVLGIKLLRLGPLYNQSYICHSCKCVIIQVCFLGRQGLHGHRYLISSYFLPSAFFFLVGDAAIRNNLI
jgi:hypothetical protein